MAMFLLFRLASLVVPLLPERLSYALATLGADLTYRLYAPGRTVVSDNLRHVLGLNIPPSQLQRAVREVFRTAARNYLDLILLPHTNLETLSHQVSWQGAQYLDDALAHGRGVILAGAHLGSFDILSQLSAQRGTPMAILVELLPNPGQFELVGRLRGSLGLRMLPATPGGIKAAIRLLRAGGMVGIACDRDVQRHGVQIDFFGEEASLPSGAIEIALRTGAAVLPCFGLRLGFRRYAIRLEPALDLPAASSLSRDPAVVRSGVLQLSRILESYLHQYPGQWVVFERIWPRRAGTAPVRRPVSLEV